MTYTNIRRVTPKAVAQSLNLMRQTKRKHKTMKQIYIEKAFRQAVIEGHQIDMKAFGKTRPFGKRCRHYMELEIG